MRIAYVSETWPPEINGVSLTASRTVAYLRQRHAVQVVRPRQPLDALAAAEDTVLMHGVPIPLYPDLRMGLPSTWRLSRMWRLQRPDLVHVATEGPLGWSAVSAARALDIPVTSDFRTRFDEYGRHYVWQGCADVVRTYLRAFHNRADATFVATDELRRWLETNGFERVNVCARGVDSRLFGPHRRSESLRRQWSGMPDNAPSPAQGPFVLYVGRLAREKNLDLLMRAWQRVRGLAPTAHLVLVGDGPLRAQLQRRCPEAVFCGVQKGETLAAHYASADLFVFPSQTETFGNVVLEAMASGLAVVAYRAAAAAMHVRNGINGRAVDPGNEDEFVSAAGALAVDPLLLARYGHAARLSVERHSWESVLGGFERALRSVVTAEGHIEYARLV